MPPSLRCSTTSSSRPASTRLLGFEVTPATVIAILTILGYSLYDTVVVFDKITENVHDLATKHTFTEIANLSMNQVLMRSVNTSLTSLLPIGSLLFVGSYMLGAATLREFALALFIGVAAGTYSSIFVATPLLDGVEGTGAGVAADAAPGRPPDRRRRRHRRWEHRSGGGGRVHRRRRTSRDRPRQRKKAALTRAEQVNPAALDS